MRSKSSGSWDQLSTIQSAMLGLLALLLGFSFALATERFSGRVKLIVDEANAIGTSWLRCDLLPDAQRDEARKLLTLYTAQCIAFYDAQDEASFSSAIGESERLQSEIWRVVVSAAKARPEISEVLLPPFNEFVDLHSTRVAAASRHIPFALIALLLLCSITAVASVGEFVVRAASPALNRALPAR